MSDQLDYTLMENGILHVVWQNNVSRQVVSDYVELFAKLMEEASEQGSLRILHDYRGVRAPSFSAMTNGMKALTLRDNVAVRIAYLQSDVTLPMIVKNATLVARFNVSRSFFQSNEKQKAIEWLLSDAD